MAQIQDLIEPEFALGELGIELMFTESVENQTEVLSVILFILGEYQDVIQIHKHKFVGVGVENVVHHSREGRWSISEAKRHDCILIGTVAHSEDNLVDIFFTNANLVITHPEIEL